MTQPRSSQKAAFFPGAQPSFLDDYHGTSGQYEEPIEKNGFKKVGGEREIKGAQRLAEIYRKLRWDGLRLAGFSTLKKRVEGGDYDNPARSLIYFGESSFRALTYATREYAGGERSRTLRHSFHDLRVYLSNPEARRKHRYTLKKYGKKPGLTLAEIHARLEDIGDLEEIARAPWENHTHGVIYAIRIKPADVHFLTMTDWAGIESFENLPRTAIIAKTLVPKNFVFNEWSTHERQVDFFEDPKGLGVRLFHKNLDQLLLDRGSRRGPIHRPATNP